MSVILALCCARFAVGADGRQPAVAGLQAWLDGTRDLQCRFEQVLLSGALGAGGVESGILYLQRPGRMRWDYHDPEPKTALVDGDRTWLFLPEDRQLVRGKLAPDQDLLPALLAGRGRIEELFRVREGGTAGGKEGTGVRLRLVPRSAPEGLQEIVLTLRPPGYAIERAEVLDAAGDRIEYRFSSLRRNEGLPAAIFTLEPPTGTEIVDQP